MTIPTKSAAEMPEEIWCRLSQCGNKGTGERISAVDKVPSTTIDHGRIKYIRADRHSEMVEALKGVRDGLMKMQAITAHMQSKRSFDMNKIATDQLAVLNAIIEGEVDGVNRS